MALEFSLDAREYYESEYSGSASESEIISWVEERLEELAGYGSGSGPLYWRPEGVINGTHIVEFSDSWGCGFIDEDTALLDSVNYVLMDEILGEYGVDVERWDMAYGDAGLVIRVLEGDGDGDSRLVSRGAVIVHEYLELLDGYPIIDDEPYSAAQFAMFMAIVMQETRGDDWTDELRGKLVQYMLDNSLGGASIDESRYWVDELTSGSGSESEWREMEIGPGCKQEWLDIPTGDVRDLMSWY